MERFWYKHMAFSWVCEFRLAVPLEWLKNPVAVPEFGVFIELDLDVLADRIYLDSYLVESDIEAVRTAAVYRGIW